MEGERGCEGEKERGTRYCKQKQTSLVVQKDVGPIKKGGLWGKGAVVARGGGKAGSTELTKKKTNRGK